jgi:hypothetical protein
VIPEPIRQILDRTSTFAAIRRLRSPDFWQAQLRAHPKLDHALELKKAAAWCAANPRRSPKSDLPRFLHRWFDKAAADDADASDG